MPRTTDRRPTARRPIALLAILDPGYTFAPRTPGTREAPRMPFEPLRFLHAANLRLDHPLGETAPLPPPVASIVQDATFAAFRRLIAAAVDAQVDFVLLAGNSFVEAEQSLAARLALLDGFAELAGNDIRVFILPGPLDPMAAWRQIPDLPENVTLLDASQKFAAVKRDETVVARVGARLRVPERKSARAAQRELRSESLRPVPVTIGMAIAADDATSLQGWSIGQDEQTASAAQATPPADGKTPDCPVDYAALGGGLARQTMTQRRGMAHDPGATQGSGPHESGPCGCTLVHVESDGTLRCEFISTAAVRWEHFAVDFEAGAGSADLLARCRALLADVQWEPGEQASICDWVFRGGRSALAAFDDDLFRRHFQQELTAAAAVPNAEALIHNFVIHASSDDLAAPLHGEPLASDFSQALAACRREASAPFAACLSDVAATDADWSSRLESLLPELDAESIASHAARQGMKLFQAAEGVSR
jgi:DNA repair protein SbcD/Mre11